MILLVLVLAGTARADARVLPENVFDRDLGASVGRTVMVRDDSLLLLAPAGMP